MEYTKPLYEIKRELASEVGRIIKEAASPEQCAKMFADLDRTHPDIHELIDRLQRATGNDRYFCMMDQYKFVTKGTVPLSLYRDFIKSDSPKYSFSTEPLEEDQHRHFGRR